MEDNKEKNLNEDLEQEDTTQKEPQTESQEEPQEEIQIEEEQQSDAEQKSEEETDSKDDKSDKKKSFFGKKDNKLQDKVDELEDRVKRQMAEFENFKKRSNKEREALYNSLLADIIASFLPVIDNLEKAVQAKTEDEGYKQGIELVLKQFVDVLTKFGVEEIKTVGETFDPEVHEAVSSIQDETKGEKEVVQEFRKGYKIGTKVIRHAMVVVAN